MSQHITNIHDHLAREHKITPLQTYLKEIVYGGSDGIVTTFAVVAGFTGAQTGNIAGLSSITVLLFGLANLFADGASMGLGNFLSLRSEQDVYRSEKRKERNEVKNNTEFEKAETREILKNQGFSDDQAEKLTNIYATNEKYWVNFMMSYELEISDPTGEKPLYTGLTTAFSFMAFGFIPLLPYVIGRENSNVFIYSCLTTLLALIILGILRWRVTTESVLRSVGETVILGSVSATIAFIVGTFFRL